jgi:hypothetical protein
MGREHGDRRGGGFLEIHLYFNAANCEEVSVSLRCVSRRRRIGIFAIGIFTGEEVSCGARQCILSRQCHVSSSSRQCDFS